MSVVNRICGACAALVTLFGAGSACAEPENGWWWNADERGRGFFVEMNGGVIYLGGYFYADDGRATWLTSGGTFTDPMRFTGTLQSYRGGQALFGPYVPPQLPVDVGPVTLEFTDDVTGTITWPGGRVAITRHVFDERAAAFQPQTGWWWNAAESGRGYSLEVQGESLFVVGFMYDGQGEPTWHFSAGRMSSPTTYQGDILQFAGGQTMTGPYRPPGTPRNIGRLAVEFAGEEEATLTFTSLASPAAGPVASQATSQARVAASPQFRNATIVFEEHWPRWRGGLQRVVTQTQGTMTQTIGYFYHDVAFDRWGGSSSTGLTYALAQGATVNVEIQGQDALSGCAWSGAQTFPVARGTLSVDNRLGYAGSLGSEASDFTVLATYTCPPFVVTSLPIPVRIHDTFRGRIVARYAPSTLWQVSPDRPVLAGNRPLHPAPFFAGFQNWRLEGRHCNYIAGTQIPTFCETRP